MDELLDLDAEVPEQQAPSPQPLEDDDDELAGLGLGEDADEGAEPAPAGDEPDADGEQAEDGGEEEHLEREASPVADEAEEEERPSAKKRTEEQEQREMQEDVRALVGRMEQAVDEDAADVLKGEPALRKLKMLSQIEAAVAKVKMHDLLLRFGFIGCLKSFLEPLETPKMSANGTPVLTLPHSKVRAAVYRALRKLPINTEHPESRDMLKAAEIGRVLSFYAKVRDETPANRRLVQDLLTAWMTPMVEEGRKAMMRPELEARKQEEERVRLKRRRQEEREAEQREAKQMAAQQEGKKLGDAGYRYHARIPRASRPDFIKAPESAGASERMQQDKTPKDNSTRARMKKVTLDLQRKRKGGESRSSKVELSTKAVGNDIV